MSEWNEIAVTTLVGDTTKQPIETFLYTAFVQAAVYDAVVGVKGRYEPYSFHARARKRTSAQAAAVAAAYKVLVTYSPSAQATLDEKYAASLARIPDGKAKTRGIAFGTRAADNLIRLRANDGRNATIPFQREPAPGVWRPTPPMFLPFSAPQFGFITPLLVQSATQFAPPPPPSLTSARYTWTPLLANPPYPEYPSGYNVFNSTVTHGLENLFHTRHLRLTLISTAVPDVERFYDTGSELRRDVINARMWNGFHFRFANTAARDMGRRLTAWTLDHYFQPVDKHGGR